jgi:hypothetical protein
MFRFVTHYWIGNQEIEKILAVAKEEFNGLSDGRGSVP